MRKNHLVLAVMTVSLLSIILFGNAFAQDTGDTPIIKQTSKTPAKTLPDIMLSNFTLNRTSVYANETIGGNFIVGIKYSNFASFRALLSVDGLNYTETFQISAPGTYSIKPFSLSNPGNYTLNIFLDDNNKIKESDESNNKASLQIMIIPRIDKNNSVPHTDDLPVVEILPDISLNNLVLAKNEIFTNETLEGNFTVDVTNATGASFGAVLSLNNSNYTEVFSLNTSGIYGIKPIGNLTSGTYQMIITADPENKINETNENNNRVVFEFRVNETPFLVNNTQINITDLNNTNVTETPPQFNNTNVTETPTFNNTNVTQNPPEFNNTNVTEIPSFNNTNITNGEFNNTNTTGMPNFNNTNETEEMPLEETLGSGYPFYGGGIPRPNSRTNIYLAGQLIQTVDSDGSNLYYHLDDQKNVRLVSDDTGEEVQETYFEPFGNSVTTTNSKFNTVLFSQKEVDLSDLSYFGARYYDKDTGKWVSPDPVFNVAESSYNYVKNNPLTLEDMDGNRPRAKEWPRPIKEPRLTEMEPGHGNDVLVPQKLPANLRSLLTPARGVGGGLGILSELISQVTEGQKNAEETQLAVNAMWNEYWIKNGVKIGPELISRRNVNDLGELYEKFADQPIEVSSADVDRVISSIKTQEAYNDFLDVLSLKPDLVLSDKQTQMLRDAYTTAYPPDHGPHVYEEQTYDDTYPLDAFMPAKRDALAKPLP